MSEKAESQIDTDPYPKHPPSPEQLVNRGIEIEKFDSVLDRISRQGPVPSNLFEWYGSPGIGKSMLVTLLAQECDKKSVPWLSINFKRGRKDKKAYLLDPIILIEDMLDDLAKKVNLGDHALLEQIKKYRAVRLPEDGAVIAYYNMDQDERLYHRPDWLDELRNVVIAFIRLINHLGGEVGSGNVHPFVLFFDETEYAEIELVDWIEEWIVNPVTQMKHCVVVWTARRPWRWKRPEIRRRLTSEALALFSPDVVKEQIASESAAPDLAEQLFKNVHIITGGHPFASNVVIRQMNTLAEQGRTITSETFSEFEPQFLREIFGQFIEHYAFKGLKTIELKTACEFMALVRLFDTTMLREVLKACAGAPFDTWEQEDFGDLLMQLKKTQLLVWEKGYALDPGLRHIIQKYYMALNRETYILANRAALGVFEDWLTRPVDNRGLFVVEELYHCAALRQVGEPVDLTAVLEKRLQEYPTWIKDSQALDNALERLEGEIGNDQELERYTQTNIGLVEHVQSFRAKRSS